MTTKNHHALADTARRRFLVGAAAATAWLAAPSQAQAWREPKPKAKSKAKPLTLKVATAAPQGTPWATQLESIQQRVLALGEGRAKLKIYAGAVLGDDSATLSRCRKGGIHMWLGTTSTLSSIIPELAALELPYLFPNLEVADEVLDKHLAKTLDKKLEKLGLAMLFMTEAGQRSIGANFGFVKAAPDLAAKKMCSLPDEVHLDTWRALGASPQALPAGEVKTALRASVVDGFDGTLLQTFASSWYQVVTHLTLTRHSYQPALALMHLDTWRGLPDPLRAALVGEAQDESESARGRKLVRDLEKPMLDSFGAAGVAIYDPTRGELEALARATKPTHERFIDKHGASFYKAITKHL
ncbi:TRAP transporter substrate-binding protein [Pseudenhygromyxa sp. WMMC2535]|uniref:TRAP transporter substrate-binding protein n=1 Tax=Pseudenhygromyxa sp. WMMC2535 TaxID=2712867 RepID=UPI001557C7BA|nr:TRAP transporter substrate-binding protein [Pseudenhygromyxa sp. WMMC2535]NVB38931.1 TRAP transporter substrate-binding protein [Pseudenhygromyxa sp. WMMC2535]